MWYHSQNSVLWNHRLQKNSSCVISHSFFPITTWYHMWHHRLISQDITMWCHMWCHMDTCDIILWYHIWYHGVIWKNECDITHDVFLCSLWFHMWYHRFWTMISHNCDITVWYHTWCHMWYSETSHDIHLWHHMWYHR